jgi:hypothetical protein
MVQWSSSEPAFSSQDRHPLSCVHHTSTPDGEECVDLIAHELGGDPLGVLDRSMAANRRVDHLNVEPVERGREDPIDRTIAPRARTCQHSQARPSAVIEHLSQVDRRRIGSEQEALCSQSVHRHATLSLPPHRFPLRRAPSRTTPPAPRRHLVDGG